MNCFPFFRLKSIFLQDIVILFITWEIRVWMRSMNIAKEMWKLSVLLQPKTV